jgi:hypothetical protein
VDGLLITVAENGEVEVHVNKEEDTAPGTVRARIQAYLDGKKKAAKSDICRLLCVLIFGLASIVCISCNISTQFFTSVLTLLIGIVVDSPLHAREWPPSTPSPPTK